MNVRTHGDFTINSRNRQALQQALGLLAHNSAGYMHMATAARFAPSRYAGQVPSRAARGCDTARAYSTQSRVIECGGDHARPQPVTDEARAQYPSPAQPYAFEDRALDFGWIRRPQFLVYLPDTWCVDQYRGCGRNSD